MKQRGEAKDIQCSVIKVLHSEELQRGGKIQLRVVKWVIDGKPTQASVEYRELYQTEDGQDRMGKAKGMPMKIILILQEKWDEVMAALGSRPSAAPAAAPAQSKPEPF